HFGLLDEVRDDISRSALKDPDERRLISAAVKGMLTALDDPYAAYLDPKAYDPFQKDVATGQYSGVGVWLKEDPNKKIKVVSVLEDTPAARAGIQSEDVLKTVGGRSVDGLTIEEVVQRIQGKPGTTVTVTVIRAGAAPQDFTLTREQIDVPTVQSKMVNGKQGLIRLISFSAKAGEKVRTAVKSLMQKGAKGFILDLRGNPGGLVSESVAVSSVFLDGGKVVSYQQRGHPQVTYNTDHGAETKFPLVVLVDEGSASASEIVAGAVQDRGRGIIVGTQTYGKGSIQDVFSLSDGSAVKFTIASYFTPSGRSIGGVGIRPDVTESDKNNQLASAERVLTGILAQSSDAAA
ncbi:MAG: S41 family peptidase, partial [Actinobacteria bacterium]|nr:S41 family peptidase [Actinomycetota bacterium]